MSCRGPLGNLSPSLIGPVAVFIPETIRPFPEFASAEPFFVLKTFRRGEFSADTNEEQQLEQSGPEGV